MAHLPASGPMKICTIFIGKPQWEGGYPYVGFDNEKLKEYFLARLKERFPHIEFLSGEIIVEYNEEKIKELKEITKSSDGLLLFTIGHYGNLGPVNAAVELISQNIPVILANYLYAGDHFFMIICDKIKGKGFRVLPISSPDFGDVEKAIEIMYKINELKGKKILLYVLDELRVNQKGFLEFIDASTSLERIKEMFGSVENMLRAVPPPGKFYVDFAGLDQAHQWRRDEEKYRKNLAEVFGVEMIKCNPEEILETYKGVNEGKAKEIADKWVSAARKVLMPYKAIFNAAKLYLALKELMQKYNTDVINVDCGTLMLTGNLPAPPCMPISILLSEGFIAAPESDMDSTISSMLGKYLTDRPGWTSNQSINLRDGRVTYLHDCPPNRLYGPDRPAQPYEIRGYCVSQNIVGPALHVDYPTGEKFTTIKISVLEKKIAVRTGKTIGVVEDDKGDGMKVEVETNARRILENIDYWTFGFHRVSFLGDFREDVIMAAKLLGLEVVEEDS